MIQLHNVYLSYRSDAPALSDVTLQVTRGEFAYLTGQSGAGKSTLLRLVYADLFPSRGQVLIDGVNIGRLTGSQISLLRRSIGVVFQDYKLLPQRTVLENVAITLEVLGWSRRAIGKKVYHTLQQLGLADKIDATPERLSGGEQQRVALARALVNDPKILVADEPTGNLDEQCKEQVLAVLRQAHARGTTVLLATHDRSIIDCRQRVIRLEKGRVQGVADVKG